jgi:transcription elongation GreA/GreB family factor
MQDIVREYFPRLYVKARVDVWDDESVMYFSAAGLQAREAERSEIVNVKMHENAKAIGEAASHGDLSENSEYKFALEERDLLRARLAQINNELSLSRVLEPEAVPTDHVSIGQRLTLRPTAGGQPLALTIMGVNDTDLAGHVYSYKTPVARQLLGKRPGDVVAVSLRDQEVEYVIEQIECAVKH